MATRDESLVESKVRIGSKELRHRMKFINTMDDYDRFSMSENWTYSLLFFCEQIKWQSGLTKEYIKELEKFFTDSKIPILLVNIDTCEELVEKYNIYFLPTILISDKDSVKLSIFGRPDGAVSNILSEFEKGYFKKERSRSIQFQI